MNTASSLGSDLPARPRRRLWPIILVGVILLLALAAAGAGFYWLRGQEAARYNWATTNFEAGQWEAAIAGYTQVLAIRPDLVRSHDALTYANRGGAYLKQGQFEAALADLERAAALGQDEGQLHLWRGQAHQGLGQDDDARAEYDAALERDPELVAAYVGRGQLYLAQGEEEEALADFEAALARDASLIDLQVTRGLLYAERGENETALAALDAALQTNRNQPEAAAVRCGCV